MKVWDVSVMKSYNIWLEFMRKHKKYPLLYVVPSLRPYLLWLISIILKTLNLNLLWLGMKHQLVTYSSSVYGPFMYNLISWKCWPSMVDTYLIFNLLSFSYSVVLHGGLKERSSRTWLPQLDCIAEPNLLLEVKRKSSS